MYKWAREVKSSTFAVEEVESTEKNEDENTWMEIYSSSEDHIVCGSVLKSNFACKI